MEAHLERGLSPENTLVRALSRLRTAAAPPDDGPPSGIRPPRPLSHVQIAEASAAGGHAARSLRALAAHADTAAGEVEAHERARAQRRPGVGYRGIVQVVPARGGQGGGDGAQGHVA
jgi:hypothetical protein